MKEMRMNSISNIINKKCEKGRKQVDRLKYIGHKIEERTKDSFFNFTHAHLIRNMITAAELDLVKREPCDRKLVWIAFYPTGGLGDYLISSKLLDELLLSMPCRIDVYCENMVFGRAVYASRPAVQILPYESMHANRFMYDVVLRVEHFVHVLSWNAHRVAKIAPEFADKLSALIKSMDTVRPQIKQQYYREALHFQRSRLLHINRWTELRHGSVFAIPDCYTYVHLDARFIDRVRELGLEKVRYITINRGADSMGRTGTQTKVWPKEHYEKLVVMIKAHFPDLRIIQLGTKGNERIAGADAHLLGECIEATKWLLRGSMLHIDCEGGLVHLAAQLAVTCIVLFGPTPLHTYAYPQNINLVSKRCSGCMGLHADWAFSCYKGLEKPECMDSLTPAYVMSHAEKYLLEAYAAKENKEKKIDRAAAGMQQAAGIQQKAGMQQEADVQHTAGIQQKAGMQQAADVQQEAGIQQKAGMQQAADVQHMAGIQQKAGMQQAAGIQQKAGMQQAADVQQAADMQHKIRCCQKRYEECRRKNPLLTMRRENAGLYAAVFHKTDACLEKNAKIALIYPKRDFLGWVLQTMGFEITEFDPDYGYSGRTGDTSFNRFSAACTAHGMDMRLGSQYQIPYASNSFDMVVMFRQETENRSSVREAERILKQGGCLIQNNKARERKADEADDSKAAGVL